MGSFSRQALGKQYDGFSDELMAQLFPNGLEDDPNEAIAPKERVIMGQPHALAYINPEEERMLMEEGGQGTMTKEGIPAYWTASEPSTYFDGNGFQGVGNFNASDNYLDENEYGVGNFDLSDTLNSRNSQQNNDDNREGVNSGSFTTGSSGTSGPAGSTAAVETEDQKRAAALTGLTGEYDAYNTSVNAFNQNFDNYKGIFDTSSGTINSATISNIYDDPNTAGVNENYFDTYNSVFGGVADALSNISLSEAPTLTSGDYTFEADELPTLAEAKDYAGLASQFSGLQGTLSGLQGSRSAEEKRITDFAGELQANLNTVGYDVNSLKNSDNTYNLNQANSFSDLDRYLFNLGQDRSGFSSEIIGQMGDPFSSFDTNYGGATGTLSGFDAAVGTEQTRIDNFNKGLLNYVDTLYGGESLGGYDVTSGSALDTLKGQIDAKQREANRFSSDLGFDFSDSLAEVQGREDVLDVLIGQRNTAQGDIDVFEDRIDDIGFDYSQDANDLGIADIDQITALQKKIATLKAEADRFDNPLSFNFNEVTGEGSALAGAEKTLSTVLTERQTEQDRIDAEGTALGGLYNQYSSTIDGLNISNIDELNTLRKNIDAAQLGAARFDSELPTDSAFLYPLEDLSSLEGNLNQLFLDRDDEVSRINTAQSNFESAANAAERSAGSGNYYSKAALDAIQDQITGGQRDISNFDSLLEYDFGAAGSDGTAVQDYLDSQGMLDELITKRSSSLDDISGGIDSSVSNLDSTELYDEDAMQEMLAELSGRGNELAYYSGGRVGDLTKNISTNRGLVNSRLDDLYGQRDEYEADALKMLTDLGDSDYSRANYDEYAGLIEPLRGNIDLYRATQANDELKGLDTELARRLGLVEADELALQQRQDQEGQGYGFEGDYSLTDPLTQAGYYNLFNEEEEELDEFGNPISAFSVNVGSA